MNYQELYVVYQIDDFSLKVMVNRFVSNQIQVLYKEVIDNEQFAENGVIINPERTGQTLKAIIEKINNLLKIKVQRIALNLPSNNLKIYQSQAMLDFKEVSHQISSSDINQVIEMTKNIIIEDDEVICLTKPYNFKVDSSSFSDSLPLNAKGQILSVESLIYSLPKTVYQSQLAVLGSAQYQLLSVTLDQFALVFNLNSFNNLVLIDWGLNNTKISLFSNSALYAINNIKIGFNQIIQALMNQMRCSYSKAERYLTKVINVNSNYLGDLIVDKYFDSKSKRVIALSKVELQNIVKNMLDEIVEYIDSFLDDVIDDNAKVNIVFTGQMVNIPGFNAYMRNFERLENVSYLANSTPGVDNYEWTALVGITRYQHNLNLFNKALLSSISSNKDLASSSIELTNKNDNINQYHSNLNLNYQYNDNK